MSNFWQRAITGTLFVIVLVGTVLWNKYSFIGLLFVIAVLGIWEYATLFKGRKNKPNFLGTVIAGVGIAFIWSLVPLDIRNPLLNSYLLGIFIACLSIPIVFEVVLNKKSSIINIGLSYAGILYINFGLWAFESLAFSKFYMDCLEAFPYHSAPVLGFLILLWSSDTFAYLTGRAFGKTPLAPKISPKKTWEGSIGGAICTIGISFILYKTMGQGQSSFNSLGFFTLFQWVGLAVIIMIFGTFGDLIESKFKRVLGVKDSGNILPGHGGILDRFDSLLFAAPFAYLFLELTMNY